MKFKKEIEDAWNVKECENVECNSQFEGKNRKLRNTIYTREGKMFIVCYELFLLVVYIINKMQ